MIKITTTKNIKSTGVIAKSFGIIFALLHVFGYLISDTYCYFHKPLWVFMIMNTAGKSLCTRGRQWNTHRVRFVEEKLYVKGKYRLRAGTNVNYVKIYASYQRQKERFVRACTLTTSHAECMRTLHVFLIHILCIYIYICMYECIYTWVDFIIDVMGYVQYSAYSCMEFCIRTYVHKLPAHVHDSKWAIITGLI